MTVTWKKLHKKLPTPESSRARYCKWKELQQTLKRRGADSDLQKRILMKPRTLFQFLKRWTFPELVIRDPSLFLTIITPKHVICYL
jgi:hypothetical protein